MASKKSKTTRRQYDPLFKLKVAYEYALGWPMDKLCEMYNISPTQVRKWSDAVYEALRDKRSPAENKENGNEEETPTS